MSNTKSNAEPQARQKPDFASTYGVTVEGLNARRSGRVSLNVLPIKKGRSARLSKKAGTNALPAQLSMGSSVYQKILMAAQTAKEERDAKRAKWKASYGVSTKRKG